MSKRLFDLTQSKLSLILFNTMPSKPLPPDLHPLDPPDIIGHARDDQSAAEGTPIAAGGLAYCLLHVLVVALAVGKLDGGHVLAVPVVAHQPRDEQLTTQLVLFGCRERVVE